MGVRRVVSSGNPYHNPVNGQFTNKPGSAGRRVAASNDYRTGKGTRRDGNTVSKTRGSNISADVRTRGNTARNVSADDAMRGTPRAVGGGGVLSSRDGNRRSMSTDSWGGLAKNIGGPRGRIGKTAGDNRENMMQTARRAGRESEKGERLSASERARRERATKSRSTESILEERYGSATPFEQPWEKRIAARTEENRRKREAKRDAIAAKKADIEAIRGGKDPYRDAVTRRDAARAAQDKAAALNPGLTSRPSKDGVRTPASRRADAANPVPRKSMAEQEAEREARFQERRKSAKYDNGPRGGVKQNDAKESDLSKIAKASSGKIVFGHIS